MGLTRVLMRFLGQAIGRPMHGNLLGLLVRAGDGPSYKIG